VAGAPATARVTSRPTPRLLLDEHYSAEIAQALRAAGHDVQAVVEDPQGSGQRSRAILEALTPWLTAPDVSDRPDEDWLA
jgi:hypothetical protein